MTEVPAETPVTTPVELTVATLVLADTHGLLVAAVPDPVNVVVPVPQILAVPLMVGFALTVTVSTLELAVVEPSLVTRRYWVVVVIPDGTSYVVLVAPDTVDQVDPPSVDFSHV